MGMRQVSFYDLPIGVLFKAARGDTGTRRDYKINQDVIYRKISQDMARKLGGSVVTYHSGNDFYTVVPVSE
jgi:hypothetical protein